MSSTSNTFDMSADAQSRNDPANGDAGPTSTVLGPANRNSSPARRHMSPANKKLSPTGQSLSPTNGDLGPVVGSDRSSRSNGSMRPGRPQRIDEGRLSLVFIFNRNNYYNFFCFPDLIHLNHVKRLRCFVISTHLI